ncbi:MAG: transglycosylase SLT domain-containing protein [Burkholderiaceae bacterium]
MIRRRTSVASKGPSWLVHAPIWTVCALGGLVFLFSGEPEAHLSGRVAVGAIGDTPVELLTGSSSNVADTLPAEDGPVHASVAPLPIPEAWPGLPPTLTGLWMEPNHAQLGAGLRLRAMEASRTLYMTIAGLERPQGGAHAGAAHDAMLQSTLGARGGKDSRRNALAHDGRAPAGDGRSVVDDGQVIQPPDVVDRALLIKRTADFLARYYRRPRAKVGAYVDAAFQAAGEQGVDPLLVTAIMSIESSLNPLARSHKGAKGLMQVLVAVHHEKFEPYGGVEKAFDPHASLMVGARILADMLSRTGSVEGALKHYVGAANLRSDGGYGAKVISMRERIWFAAHGKSVPREIELATAIERANFDQGVAAGALRTAAAVLPGGGETRVD